MRRIDIDTLRLGLAATGCDRLRAVAERAEALLADIDADIAEVRALEEQIQAIRLRRRILLRRIVRTASSADLAHMLEASSDDVLRDVSGAELDRRRERAALDRAMEGGHG